MTFKALSRDMTDSLPLAAIPPSPFPRILPVGPCPGLVGACFSLCLEHLPPLHLGASDHWLFQRRMYKLLLTHNFGHGYPYSMLPQCLVLNALFLLPIQYLNLALFISHHLLSKLPGHAFSLTQQSSWHQLGTQTVLVRYLQGRIHKSHTAIPGPGLFGRNNSSVFNMPHIPEDDTATELQKCDDELTTCNSFSSSK